MDTETILAAIDAEIYRLQQAKALLTQTTTDKPVETVKAKAGRKRHMGAKARKMIAEAQKARWAAAKAVKAPAKASAKKPAALSVK